MANVNAPFGLQLIQARGGYSFNAQGNLYSCPSTDNTIISLNDAVKAAASSDANGVPNIAKCAGTDAIRGVVQGVLPVYPGPSLVGTTLALNATRAPATKAKAYYFIVNDDETSVYMIQDDGITTANLVAASANLNSTLTIANGATDTSPSATVLLSSSFAVTNTFNIKLNGLVQGANQQQNPNAYGAYARWRCFINVSELTGSFVGI